MSHKLKPLPAFIPITELAPYVEAENELSKSDLISRIAGKVKRELLQLMKMIQFHRIYKDRSGNMFLL